MTAADPNAAMAELEAAFEQVQEMGRRAERQLAGLDGFQDEIRAIEAIVRSPDRTVTVTAGPGGAVTGIELTSEAMKTTAQSLAATIMSTLQQAVAQAARQQAVITQRFVGDDLDVLDQVLQTQADTLGTSIDELRAAIDAAQPQPARPVDEDAEDFAGPITRSVSDRTGGSPATPAPRRESGGTAGDDFLRRFQDDE